MISFLTLSLDTGDTRSTISLRATIHTHFLLTLSLESNFLRNIFNTVGKFITSFLMGNSVFNFYIFI